MLTRKDSVLNACPHSDKTCWHSWHGLPLYFCRGSHLPSEEAIVVMENQNVMTK